MAKCTIKYIKFSKNFEVILRILILMICLCFVSCSDDDVTQSTLTGSGVYTYLHSPTDKQLRVFYYVPQNFSSTTPIVFSFHGANRNARDYRDALVLQAEILNFIVIAPEFSDTNFSGGDGYNLGNVYVDGDNPSPSTLNSEEEWAFSVIAPLFEEIKNLTDNSSTRFHVFGHSAGGQFAHRLLLFKPELPIEKMVISAPGWYTFPDVNVSFPYGLGNSILNNNTLDSFFSTEVFVQVGDNDDNPNAGGLRRNQLADAQGLNRKERAINFFDFCDDLAEQQGAFFNWQFHIIPNTGHDYVEASIYAVNLIF